MPGTWLVVDLCVLCSTKIHLPDEKPLGFRYNTLKCRTKYSPILLKIKKTFQSNCIAIVSICTQEHNFQLHHSRPVTAFLSVTIRLAVSLLLKLWLLTFFSWLLDYKEICQPLFLIQNFPFQAHQGRLQEILCYTSTMLGSDMYGRCTDRSVCVLDCV